MVKVGTKVAKGVSCENPWITWSNGQPSHIRCLSSECPGHPTPTPGVRAPKGKASSIAHHQSCEQETHHGSAAHNFQCQYRTQYEHRRSPLQAQKYNIIWFTQTKEKIDRGPMEVRNNVKNMLTRKYFQRKNTNLFTFFLVCL